MPLSRNVRRETILSTALGKRLRNRWDDPTRLECNLQPLGGGEDDTVHAKSLSSFHIRWDIVNVEGFLGGDAALRQPRLVYGRIGLTDPRGAGIDAVWEMTQEGKVLTPCGPRESDLCLREHRGDSVSERVQREGRRQGPVP